MAFGREVNSAAGKCQCFIPTPEFSSLNPSCSIPVDIFTAYDLEMMERLITFRIRKSMQMEPSPSTDEIKEALIKSCLALKPSLFKPFLASEKVTVECVDKEAFFGLYKYMLQGTRKISEGELSLKIKTAYADNQQEYCFYDAVHLHPCLTILVQEDGDTVHLGMMPF